MILEENWAVSPQRARAFFSGQEDVVPVGQGFSFGCCTITVTPLQGQICSMPIARSLIRFEGPEQQVRTIHQRFFLRFLSAGG